ncbi:lipopolysaccharide biosynthesis protein [Flavobacterium hauense]
MNPVLSKVTLKKYFSNQSFIFVVINIFVAFLGFVRSFAFMKFFNFSELGTITMVSTAASFIGFFQIGLINGGYRIIALRELESEEKVNNVLFSYFGCLFCVLTLICSGIYFFDFFDNILILAVSLVMGFCMLLTNWLTNMLIGAQEYRKLNAANGISALISLLCLLLAYFYGLSGALISILAQPCLLLIIIVSTHRVALPTKFDFDLAYIKYVLSFGFIPFLSGMFILMYTQIERWSIISYLGQGELGKLYLYMLITTLWLLVPSSVLNLFFPKTIKLFSEGDYKAFHDMIRKNIIVTFCYCAVASLSIFFLLEIIVGFVFPVHKPYVFLIVAALPGFVFRTLADPMALYLNSIVKLMPILWSELFSIIVYLLCVLTLVVFNRFSLLNMIICFNIYYIFKFCYLFIVYKKSKEKGYA